MDGLCLTKVVLVNLILFRLFGAVDAIEKERKDMLWLQ
jgi:hypothetical protein